MRTNRLHCHFNSNFFPMFLTVLLGDYLSPLMQSVVLGVSFIAPHFNNMSVPALFAALPWFHLSPNPCANTPSLSPFSLALSRARSLSLSVSLSLSPSLSPYTRTPHPQTLHTNTYYFMFVCVREPP